MRSLPPWWLLVVAHPAQAAGAATLSCAIATAPGPVSFAPVVRLQRRLTTVTATLALRDCTSADGRRHRLRSGTMTLRGTAQAGCTGASNVRGTAAITWYDGSGRRAGASRLVARRGATVRFSLADALLGGRVSTGVLSGRTAHGALTPVGTLTRCYSQGLKTLHGTGRLTFS